MIVAFQHDNGYLKLNSPTIFDGKKEENTMMYNTIRIADIEKDIRAVIPPNHLNEPERG